jgi:hypothetical protein
MKDPTDQTKVKEFCNGLVMQIRTNEGPNRPNEGKGVLQWTGSAD